MRRAWLLLTTVLACGAPPEAREAIDSVRAAPRGFGLANWNVEWFGSPDRGPVDDELQRRNVRAVIESVQAGLWVLSEISEPAAFEALKSSLPGYSGLLSSDPEVLGGRAYYQGREQRLGLLYDHQRVQVERAELILTEHDFDFAGRPPLRVDVHLDLPEGRLPLTVVAVHLKAFGDADSHERRARSARALGAWLDQVPEGRAVLVAGDWNDGLEGSTVEGRDSPFAELARSPSVQFWTLELARSGAASYVGGEHFLDHQLANRALDPVRVSTHLVEVDRLVPDFEVSTSDHYPVVTTIDLHRALSINEVLANEPGRDRSQEMVELVNLTCAVVELSGLNLNDRNLAGTIGPGAALAIRHPRGLGLMNEGGTVALRDGRGTLEVMSYPASLAQLDGVSMNRTPDGTRSPTWRSHRALSPQPSSPGRRVDGGEFACPNP